MLLWYCVYAGLDTCLAIMRVLHAGLGDSKYRPCPLLVQYVDAGKCLQSVPKWHNSACRIYIVNAALVL